MPRSFLFTSESVSEGHPDKMADQISDAILDALLEQDPNSRVGCETLVNTGLAMVSGEITTTAQIDTIDVVRDTIKQIGYCSSDMGYDHGSCSVIVALDKQSPDIAQGVNEGEGVDLEQGAGDQGLMFGFACKETDVSDALSHHLCSPIGQTTSRRAQGRHLAMAVSGCQKPGICTLRRRQTGQCRDGGSIHPTP